MNRVRPASPPDQDSQRAGSHCEPVRAIIGESLHAGLSAKRIHQDLVAEHGCAGKYWSMRRFVHSLQSSGELPFRRSEVDPGEQKGERSMMDRSWVAPCVPRAPLKIKPVQLKSLAPLPLPHAL